jgi:glucose-1-phosphate adenylyltransferase
MANVDCPSSASRPRRDTRRPGQTHPLLGSTFAVVLAGGRGTRLQQLTDARCKPAMPFAGQLRIIDFTLSNCVNSGVRRIAVLTQYKAQSLIRHVTRGWGRLDSGLGEFIDVVPAQQQIGAGWYSGTADAVFQNLEMLRDAAPTHVLVLAADHVYRMDYGRLLDDHVRCGAEVSVACLEVPLEQASEFGVLQVDAAGQATGFDEKPCRPLPRPGCADVVLASMGVYVFEAEVLYRELARDAADPGSGHDFGNDILPGMVERHRVHAHNFALSCVERDGHAPYWRDVGTLDAYWEANLELTRPTPALDLYDERWPIHSRPEPLAPAKFVSDGAGHRGTAVDSLVAGGCIVSGATVVRSVLFSKVRVGDASVVEDSLLLPGVVVGRGVTLRRVIVDTGCVVPDGLRVGVNPVEDRARFTVTEHGVVLVTPAMLAQALNVA